MKKHLDFIEIGTSDFDNLITVVDDETYGISIEPIKVYFHNLPIKQNVKKLNCAISNTDGEFISYWIDPEDIKKYDLPNWIRGCGTINSPHPLVLKELTDRNLLHIYKYNKCEVLSWKTLLERENINSIKFLKIDAEGSDYNILEDILQTNTVIPDTIQFENKDFIDNNRLNDILIKFLKIGYEYVMLGDYDILLKKLK